MLKRTKGRILLTMLVITGLAGTINNSTLSNQERKFAVTQLKDGRFDVLSSIKGMTDNQLRFRPAATKRNISGCLYHITSAETWVWNKIENAMKQPATPEKRLELPLSDKDLLKTVEVMVTDILPLEFTTEMLPQKQPASSDSFSAMEAISAFKSYKTEQLKYVKTTTEDLRNHFVKLPIGWVDCYQALIFMTAYSSRYIGEIKQIVADPTFPKK